MQVAIDAVEKHIAETQSEETESYRAACMDIATV
jgi:hypothetical protein